MGMDSNGYWQENVGTQSNPISRLHERAVALIYGELMTGLRQRTPVQVRCEPEGELSDDVLEGVWRVSIPSVKAPILRHVPDIALFNEADDPIRVIEVHVTSSPSKEQHKAYEAHAIEIVECKVNGPEDLIGLCDTRPTYRPLAFAIDADHPSIQDARLLGQTEGTQSLPYEGGQAAANKFIYKIIESLEHCSPSYRRLFFDVLRGARSLDSLYPIYPDNPKKSILEADSQ